MEELCAARTFDSTTSGGKTNDEVSVEESLVLIEPQQSAGTAGEVVSLPSAQFSERPETPDLLETALTPIPSTSRPTHSRSRSRKVSISNSHSDSVFCRLRALFGDLWRSPVAVARYLIQTVQARMRIPRPLVNVQWWLVGVLLGPMARRRALSPPALRTDIERQPPLLDRTISDTELGGLAYGSIHGTPIMTPRHGSPKNHDLSEARHSHTSSCMHHRAKHGPWLWIKFSLTLAFAIGVAFKDGPGSLLRASKCRCRRDDKLGHERIERRFTANV